MSAGDSCFGWGCFFGSIHNAWDLMKRDPGLQAFVPGPVIGIFESLLKQACIDLFDRVRTFPVPARFAQEDFHREHLARKARPGQWPPDWHDRERHGGGEREIRTPGGV